MSQTRIELVKANACFPPGQDFKEINGLEAKNLQKRIKKSKSEIEVNNLQKEDSQVRYRNEVPSIKKLKFEVKSYKRKRRFPSPKFPTKKNTKVKVEVQSEVLRNKKNSKIKVRNEAL